MDLNNNYKKVPFILVAEDDPDDRFLIEMAFQECGYPNSLFFVEDGEELMDFLLNRKQFSEKSPQMPVCLVLDLKMPRKNGREALKEIRQNPKYKDLPIIVLSTSDSEHDKEYCTSFGITDYITKPDSFAGLLAMAEKTRGICLSPKP